MIPALRSILEQLISLGATISSVSIPSTPHALSAYYVISSAEASSNLARYDGTRFGSSKFLFLKALLTFEQVLEAKWTVSLLSMILREDPHFTLLVEVKRLARKSKNEYFWGLTLFLLSRLLLLLLDHDADRCSYRSFDNYFLQAQRVRKMIQLEFNDIFRSANPLAVDAKGSPDGVDILIHPSSISTAPLISAISNSTAGYVQDILNVPSSLAGLPAISIRAGTASNGWPVGVQLVGNWGADNLILKVAKALQKDSL